MAAQRRFDRSPWRLDPTVSYLNHGSFGACPEPVLDAQRAWRDRLETEPVQFLDRELETHLDEARAQVAAFLGADAEGIAFVPNATTGVATVLASLHFKPGDELLACDHEYNATLNAMRAVADRDGARVVLARIPFPIAHPARVIEAYLEAVTPRTRFALVSHVTSPTALVFPVQTLVKELAKRGIDVLIDGAHAPGMIPVDLQSIGAAWWTGNGHKWLCAPKGAAVLYARADVRDAVHPLVTSHAANSARRDRSRYLQGFDWTGTGDPAPYLSLPAAIRFVGALDPDGWPGLMAANTALALAGRQQICEALGVEPPAPGSMLGSMASILVPGVAPTAEATRALSASLLAEDRIEVPVFAFPVPAALAPGAAAASVILRISAQRYNTPDEYAALAEALRRRLVARTSARSRVGWIRGR